MSASAIRAAAVLGLFAVMYFFSPPAIPLCGFRWLTGHPCPLCGLTRALLALAKGHVGAALRFHALSPLAVMMLGALVWNRPLWPRFWTCCAVAFGVYGVWRLAA